jgi:predicted CoA-substrate-specific enzyme activase
MRSNISPTKYYLGIDIGSVTIKVAICDENGKLVESHYLRTHGNPLQALEDVFKKINFKEYSNIAGVGTTGSARQLIGKIVGADVIKNEITAHTKAVGFLYPKVRTIIEIGGQDSKLIMLKNGIVSDFAMNTVCAAGTGSFLDQQASRLNMDVAKMGEISLKSKTKTKITARCTVFAESDMIQKQQVGVPIADIFRGLCDSLAVNYLNNLAKSKKLELPIVFVGGVAANVGIINSFKEILGQEVSVPKEHNITGAYGMALLAKKNAGQISNFKGWQITNQKHTARIFDCKGCENNCEITQILSDNKIVGHLGSRCQKYV